MQARPDERLGTAERLIESYRAKGLTDFDVLVARDGRPVFREAFGFADIEHGGRNSMTTEFRIGSVTKQFTAFAILDLARSGKLRLDDPISRFIDDAPASWRDVTIRHLLGHTSGIPNFTEIPGLADRTNLTPNDLVAALHDLPLLAPPGSKFAYDNSGYALLGRIVEKASGRSLGAYLSRRVFEPFGMRHTGFVTETMPPGAAHGVSHVGDRWVVAPWMSNIRQSGAGALYSTADDLLTWDRALHGGKLLGRDDLALMFSDRGHGFGFGEVIGKEAGRRVWWHNGHVEGYGAMLARYPDDGLTIVVLTNDDAGPVEKLSRELAALWLNPQATAETSPGSAPTPGRPVRGRTRR